LYRVYVLLPVSLAPRALVQQALRLSEQPLRAPQLWLAPV
jgi:hypothetical protein